MWVNHPKFLSQDRNILHQWIQEPPEVNKTLHQEALPASKLSYFLNTWMYGAVWPGVCAMFCASLPGATT